MNSCVRCGKSLNRTDVYCSNCKKILEKNRQYRQRSPYEDTKVTKIKYDNSSTRSD